MYKEISWEEARGKTVKKFVNGWFEQMIIIFTDETFTTLEAEQDRYEGDLRIEEKKLKLFDFGDDLLIENGVATDTELEVLREETKRQWKADRIERDRETYEQLKKQFEGS